MKLKSTRIKQASLRWYRKGYRKGYDSAMERAKTISTIMYTIVLEAQRQGTILCDKYRRRVKASAKFKYPHPLNKQVSYWMGAMGF
jgi:hypothetical protein